MKPPFACYALKKGILLFTITFKLIKYSNNTIRSSQFSIGQTYDKHILKAILTYFNREEIKISSIINKENVPL